MERLQAAIEKARIQRREGAAAERTAQTPDGATDAVTTAGEGPAAAPAPGIADRWRALRPLDTSGPAYRDRDRLVAFRPGAQAAPYDMLRTRVIQQASTHGWKRIAVVSPHAGSGKTTTAANLAFSFGRQSDLRTMVLDFDLRRASLAALLEQQPGHTMADVLEGQVSFAEHAYIHDGNLAFGLSRSGTAYPAELLHSQRAVAALAAIEADYAPDFMFFDLPPLFAADDSIGFLRNVDCALLVVAAEETPMSKIDAAERQVAEVTQVMGVVLNKCRVVDEAYAYDYGAY